MYLMLYADPHTLAIFGGTDLLRDPPEWLLNEKEEFNDYDNNDDGK